VLYNLGVMSYTERYREMATLKVVGFKDSKIGRLLISQNLWLTVAGIVIGIPAGIGILQYLLTALAAEYELKLVLGPATWLISVLLTFGVSLVVGLMVARKNRHIDMVAALKTEE
jgi:putative ABC transport system permease protein